MISECGLCDTQQQNHNIGCQYWRDMSESPNDYPSDEELGLVPERSMAETIDLCHRLQNPDSFGGQAVPEPVRDDSLLPASTETLVGFDSQSLSTWCDVCDIDHGIVPRIIQP